MKIQLMRIFWFGSIRDTINLWQSGASYSKQSSRASSPA